MQHVIRIQKTHHALVLVSQIILRTIENFQTINSGKILFPLYQLKMLELTEMAWKSVCKYVLRLWMSLHHKRKIIPEVTICHL